MESKEAKSKELERELESCHGRLDGFGKELKSLLTEINAISGWIYERFGVNLTDKSRYRSCEDNREVSCEEVEVTDIILLGLKSNLVNNSTESGLDKIKPSTQPTVTCNDIKLFNTSDISSPDFPENGNVKIEISKKRRGGPKQALLHSPTVQVTGTDNQAVPKRGRPKRKDISNIAATPVKCAICEKMLKDAGSLRQHQLIHKNVTPYPCPECGKCFKRKFHLKTHSLIHAGVKKHQCGHCGKLFLLPKDLVAHERTHTGEKPFSCNVCPKSFNLKSHLVMHLRTHTGEKPYKCEICEKYFSQSNSLRVHKKVHQKPRNTNKSSLARQQRRPVKQEICPIPTVYSIPNSVSRSLQNPINSSDMEMSNTLSPQSSLPSSAVNIPVSNLVSFEIIPMSTSVAQHQHESRNAIHRNTIIKIESNNLTVQDGFQLQPEISNPVEIISLSHVNIEQVIGHENNVNKNVEQVNENIDKENFTGNNVGESYFF